MITINMMSKADTVQGQGVLSAHDEQLKLVREELKDQFQVMENSSRVCDITHYHTINPQFLFSLIFAKHKRTAVGYVHFLPETLENSIHLPTLFKRAFYWYVIRFYKSMDYLVTVNPYFIERLAFYGVDPHKVSYIPNFVSEDKFYKIDDKRALRRKHHFDPDRFTVFCAGQLQKRKGVLEFLEIARQMPDIQFLWAGNFAFGKISDGYEEIKKAVENPPENVIFLGLINRDQMNEYYNLADVMFLPSFEELFPMTILESMNCGVPILLRDLDIYKDILFDYYLKGSGNDEFIAELRRLQQDPQYYQMASDRSFEGHQFYSRNHVAKMWQSFYSAVAYGEKDVNVLLQAIPASEELKRERLVL
jgi:1,2-diacylglycerol-3-alpha-glucose alpha-1,2-galactosyltransferase